MREHQPKRLGGFRTARGTWLMGCCMWLAFVFQVLATDAPPERENAAAPARMKADPPVTAKPNGTLALELAGEKAFKEKRLRVEISRQIKAIEESQLDEATADDAAFFLNIFYRKQGYSQVAVRAAIPGPNRLQLRIDEGPLTKLGDVTFRGNTKFDSATLLNYLSGPTRERFPRIRKDRELPFVKGDIDQGADLIHRLYLAEGFLHAVVEPPVVSFGNDNTRADIAVKITEGIQYHFGAPTYSGTPIFPHAELQNVIAKTLAQPWSPGRAAAMEHDLDAFYKKRGYFTASVGITSDPATANGGIVPVIFTITAGPRYRFDGIAVRGLDQLHPSFLERRFGHLSGRIYDPDEIDKKFREMMETGLFSSLRINPEAIPGEQVRLNLEVEEAKPKEFGFALGFETFEGAYAGVSYTNRDLGGRGRPLTFATKLSARGYSGEVLYTDPWLFESDYRLRLRLYAVTRDEFGYTKNEYGFHPTLSRKITEHWEVSAFALAKSVTVKDSKIMPLELLGPTNYNVDSIGVATTIDFRNSKVTPTRGLIVSGAFEAAAGGKVQFLRATGRLSYYVPIQKTVLAFGARAGVMTPQGGAATLPIDERFFNGGATTVRSFAERELGPQAKGDYPIGGDAFTVFNVEYTVPLTGDLGIAAFGDAGSVTSRLGDRGGAAMRYGIGLGLRYNLPIGPIRLDYGLNPSPRENEKIGAFHFSIGVAF